MKRTMFVIPCAILLVVGLTARAQAQAEHYGPAPIELNAHVGALFIDTPKGVDSDTDPMYGLRLGYNTPGGLGFAANLDWIPGERNFGGTPIDINTWLYSGELNYTFRSPSRIHFFLAAGVGGATRTFSDIPGDDSIDSTTDLLVPVGGGFKWFSQGNRWGLRGDVRDNIVVETDVFDPEEGDKDTKARNHIEVSGGISIFFGG